MSTIKRINCGFCESLQEIEYEVLANGDKAYIKLPTFSKYEYETKSGQLTSFHICLRCKRMILAIVNEFCENEGLIKKD